VSLWLTPVAKRISEMEELGRMFGFKIKEVKQEIKDVKQKTFQFVPVA
jgi:hypothetical protein